MRLLSPYRLILSAMLLAGTLAAQEVPKTIYIMQGWGSNALSKINLETEQSQLDYLTDIGNVPNKIIAFNEMLYLVNSTPDEIKVLDPRHDQSFSQSIALPAGSNPWDMAFTGTSTAYVTLFSTHQVSRVNLETGLVEKTFDIGLAPEGVTVENNEAWITCTGYNGYGSPYQQAEVKIVDTATDSVIAAVPVPTNAQVITRGPDPSGFGGTLMHVLCTGDYAGETGRVVIIDRWAASANWNPAAIDTIDIGGSPGDLVITPEGKAYVAAYGGTTGEIMIYDAMTYEIIRGSNHPIPVGPGVMNMLYDDDEKCLWLANSAAGTIQKFSTVTDTVVATYTTGFSPADLAIIGPLGRPDPGADAVVSFIPGQGAGFGASYFPANVLGLPDPDPAISATSPCANPKELLSLGVGGEIVLSFEDNEIVDGEGPDLIVFENAFETWNGEVVREPGEVSVSQDGQTWFTFPWDTSNGSFVMLAGVTPTRDNQQPLTPGSAGGDHFDLSISGMATVRYVKIRDLGAGMISGNSSGFDLDAVVAVNSQANTPVLERLEQPAEFSLAQNYPNPFNPSTEIRISLQNAANVTLAVYNQRGQRLTILCQQKLSAGTTSFQWNGTDSHGTPVASGLYIARLTSGNLTETIKMLLVR